MKSELRSGIESALNVGIMEIENLSGGDINDAYKITMSDGAVFFVKSNQNAPEDFFQTEANGLRWLADANAIKIPDVVHVEAADGTSPSFLVLEFVESRAKVPNYDELLGHALAELHRAGASRFGLDHDNFIGTLPQLNDETDDWAEFYWRYRVEPLVRMARDASNLSSSEAREFGKLEAVIENRVGPKEPPARLHGDLWSGNLHTTEDGRPCLIDPAAYGGHREIDLAMMRLFGAFSENVFKHYEELHPLAEESEPRVPLYQLYPLLVHVNLFGNTYLDGAMRALRRML